MMLSHQFFSSQSLNARLFSLAAPFPALMILLDKCQMKSFENINILIEVNLFCLKTFFLEKAFIQKISLKKKLKKLKKKKLLFEPKNFFFF